MRPYKLISEDTEAVTYEYNSSYTWALYFIVLLMIVGMSLEHAVLELSGVFLILVYFIAKLSLGKQTTSQVNAALKSDSVVLSGNKHSFSNPLRIKVPRNA